MRKILTLLLIATFGALFATTSMQAGSYGSLKGKVVDEDGKPVTGATVKVEGTTRGAMVKNGAFTIIGISPGTYVVKITMVGYQDYKTTVVINIDTYAEINAKITTQAIVIPGGTVWGDNKMVDNGKLTQEDKYSNKDLVQTTGTNPTAAASLSAGVLGGSNGFNIRGSREEETKVMVDGHSVGDNFTGGFGLTGLQYFPMASSYATEEVQVLTGGFPAEYGDVMGGVVNTVKKTGRTDKYEGFVRWYTDLPSLNGSQEYGLKLYQEPTRIVAKREGEGAKLQGSQQNTFDIGIGGPLEIGLFKNSTFFLTTNYFFEKFRGASYEVYNPVGLNLGQPENDQTWEKYMSLALKFQLTTSIALQVGGEYGMTNANSQINNYATSTGYKYAVVNENGKKYINYNDSTATGMQERVAQADVINSMRTSIYMKLRHDLTEKSYYELTVSDDIHSDEVAKRTSSDDPTYFGGYTIWKPQDEWAVDASGSKLVWGQTNKVLDNYEFISKYDYSQDKYLPLDKGQINPLTGYIEGPYNSTGTNNPYGINGYTHGNTGGINFRYQYNYEIEGNYNQEFTTGEFVHTLKTGLDVSIYELHHFSSNDPSDASTFIDVYTDKWGGNLYAFPLTTARAIKTYQNTSKPFKPYSLAAYVQDQVSYKGIKITPGLRFDLFDPKSKSRPFTNTFIPISSDSLLTTATVKTQVSPRINITYPLTDRSNINIAYGLFYQMPKMQYLYDSFNKDLLRGNDILGDPDLKAQRTNAYQVGYSNEIVENISIDISTYYRDIYNQLGTKWVSTIPSPYFSYAVAEFGNARGVEFTVKKRANPLDGDHVAVRLNYTISSVRGTSSSPEGNYMAPTDPYTGTTAYPLAEYPMSQDRTHVINALLNLTWADKQGPTVFDISPIENTDINLIGLFESGAPYTKTSTKGNALSEYNAERGPSYWNIDLKVTRRFSLSILGESFKNKYLTFYVDIYNVLNSRYAYSFYSTTGDPIDNGITYYETKGIFSSTPWYKTADFGVTETFRSDQYDTYGYRLYNRAADFDQNQIVTQDEKYQAWVKQLQVTESYQTNYKPPRTVYFGVVFQF